MRICFVVCEIFHWGKYGGFGALTRTIGKRLVEKGSEVYVVTWKGRGQRTIEQLDGFTVLSYNHPRNIFDVQRLAKLCEADLYHIVEPYVPAFFTTRATPKSKHLVHFQDPWDLEDFRKMASVDPQFAGLYNYLLRYFHLFVARKTTSKADALFCQAKFIIPKVMRMYRLDHTPGFLPNPVEIPERQVKKSSTPMVCFLGRWDPVKRVEMFLSLVNEFPDVTFVAMGKAHGEERDRFLREKYAKLPNVVLRGFVSEEEKSKILEKSWILINTSVRECLPVSFLEACAHKTAILSSENPDNFAEDFGFHVQNDNFTTGLRFLLDEDKWKEKGKRGFEYVKDAHELDKVINKYLEVYENLLE